MPGIKESDTGTIFVYVCPSSVLDFGQLPKELKLIDEFLFVFSFVSA